MIQLLASRYRKHIAYTMLFIFYIGAVLPVYGRIRKTEPANSFHAYNYSDSGPAIKKASLFTNAISNNHPVPSMKKNVLSIKPGPATGEEEKNKKDDPDIDGPSQPEMSSFKPAGTNDMVNLFTGDFSYNIPLLDVGGYPVNIFYDGGISMEQEASWVGLGWNINPGNVNRNMRGVPDDFDGTEKLIQEQNMKPNKTWGVRVGADYEIGGNKKIGFSVGGSLGVSFNNYLGPALDLGIKGGVNFMIAGKALPEKSGADSFNLKIKVGASGNLSSRSGLTMSPNISLASNFYKKHNVLSNGLSVSTSYNSRNGIKGLQITDQLNFSGKQRRLDAKLLRNFKGSYYKTYTQSYSFHLSSSISFNKPSYIPAMRASITNDAFSGHFQFGVGLILNYASVEAEVYSQKSEIAVEDVKQSKPMIGYLHYQKAKNNREAIMDFTRFNDNEVTPNTPVISAPQFAYDAFVIQGEGTGGSFRAYRNDIGYVRDNYTISKDRSDGIGVDIGPPGHYGANYNLVKTPSTIGEWMQGNSLKLATPFAEANGLDENVYFRSPGESTVLDIGNFDEIGGAELVRYKLEGSGLYPYIEPKLQRLSSQYAVLGETSLTAHQLSRKKRTQVISCLTASEAANIGLDKTIKNYNRFEWLGENNQLNYTDSSRTNAYRKPHHISQVNVTEADGKRYVYGLPVYNLYQKDFSFTVNATLGQQELDTIAFNSNETTPASPHINTSTGRDGYVLNTETPPYAHSYLLTGLLSPDYVDVSGDGITENDIGGAVKFNYTRVANHKWRTPLSAGMKANFNAGNRSEVKDDKGIISCGERESWYLHSIESKTMIAFFTLENRHDGKGPSSLINGGINNNDSSLKRLKQIDLYNKADLKKNGVAGAKPIKTVHFSYSYTLCSATPDNTTSGEGKLSLTKIWFTYNGQVRDNKNQYVFSYSAGDTPVTGENPSYEFAASDRWGNYKSASDNPGALKNADFPYVIQDKTIADRNAQAWQLKKILLPSGGQLEVSYESDDYSFVQDKRAAVMSNILGFSNTSSNPGTNLYNISGTSIVENDYVFIKVPVACANKAEVYQKYLEGISQLAFKLAVKMPSSGSQYRGTENLFSYATIADYDKYTGAGFPAIWIKLNKVSGLSPLSLTAIEYLREHLPGQAFPGYDVSESQGLEQIGDLLMGMAAGLKSAFRDIGQYLRSEGKAQETDLSKSFVRLNDPDGFKFGGGQRVKTIKLKDNWNRMTGQFTSVYGQEYDYTTEENFNGSQRKISSGVASYEPSMGGEENPFQTILQVSDKLPLGPASYEAIEMPVLDAFFQSPIVGYSKVTVTSIGKKQNTDTSSKTRSPVGKQVTEFYTAKDFPVYYNYSPLDPSVDKQAHKNSFSSFLFKYAFDSRALSQGFIVAMNDMHGKMKSQSSYAEGDLATRINYTENFYRNTGVNRLDEKFDFVRNWNGGDIVKGNMGIDIELMTDTREFSTKSNSFEVQAQVDNVPFPPFWLPFVWPITGTSENTYRAVTVTKVINYHAVLDSVVVIDKGSQVSTKNMVYDAETGQVIVNRTNNEFDKAIYSINYPAYWAYSGMGLAYKNIDAVYTGIDFLDGKIEEGIDEEQLKNIFESGDELYITDDGDAAGCDAEMDSPAGHILIWALNKNKNETALTDTDPDFIFIDKDGKPYSRSNVSFRIVRSGHRNMLGASVASASTAINPVKEVSTNIFKLVVDEDSKVINASAVEYKEKWQADNDVFKRYKTIGQLSSSSGNLAINGDFTAGYTGFSTDYTYSPYTTTPGSYRINTTSSNWYYGAPYCYDHTSPPYENFLHVDGSASGDKPWYQNITVKPNTVYNFSAYINSINDPGTPTPVGRVKLVVDDGTASPVESSAFSADAGPCAWKRISMTWTSGTDTTIQIAIKNNEFSGPGNDYGIDDILFIAESVCSPEEVEDCEGYLEKKINPYRKGLLGNFRGYRNMVFYGEREQSSTAVATNLPVHGYLKDFSLYWDFNNDNNLVADNAGTKWVWNTQSTRFNSKGLELETKDALGIYTSAQYGYQKTIPVAIANNSRSDKMFFDGFEDYDYAETLNGAVYNTCNTKHVDFSGIANSEIIDAAGLGFAAHTGKYVLKVDAGDTATRNFVIKTDDVDSFDLKFKPYIVPSLYEPGGAYTLDPGYSLGSIGVKFGNLTDTVASPVDGLLLLTDVALTTTQYIEVTEQGTYTFTLKEHNVYGTGYASHAGTVNFIDGILTIRRADNDLLIGSYTSPQTINHIYDYHNEATISYTVILCPGVYKLQLAAHSTDESQTDYIFQGCISSTISYKCSNNFTSHKSLHTTDGCSYTKPVAAADSMINQNFSLTALKKMVFSAWVKEDCGDPQGGTPCNKTKYTDNEVRLYFGSGNSNNVTLKPSGPIIEGWQRYEGYFTVANVTTANLRLVNNSAYSIYFDDIRIHPFNANMKSYVYDPVNLRLTSELDANNYASFYEYDEEGTLIRTKAETRQGIKTITESRSAKQKTITDF